MNTGLFETTKTTNEALANNLTNLLDQYGLKKIITYVKNEGLRFNNYLQINCEM
jgi:hypothetical protein